MGEAQYTTDMIKLAQQLTGYSYRCKVWRRRLVIDGPYFITTMRILQIPAPISWFRRNRPKR